jgi:type I restriction enzyme S subunit
MISEIVRGGSPRPIEDFVTTNSDGLNWLKIGDVSTDSKYIINTQERVIKAALNKTREVYPGDLILSNSMSFGRPYILKIKCCIHDGWIAITNLSSMVDIDYLYYLISSNISGSSVVTMLISK